MIYTLKHEDVARQTKYVHEAANVLLDKMRFTNEATITIEFGGHIFAVDRYEFEAILRKAI